MPFERQLPSDQEPEGTPPPRDHPPARSLELVCSVCGQGRIRRPLSAHRHPVDGEMINTPWFHYLATCPHCRTRGSWK
ncbi:MAG TPA: hypothetical protein VGU02_01060 [Gaiellaceae bacterium]|nr:hypothetical protein [Gaiellaceae bacterium]